MVTTEFDEKTSPVPSTGEEFRCSASPLSEGDGGVEVELEKVGQYFFCQCSVLDRVIERTGKENQTTVLYLTE